MNIKIKTSLVAVRALQRANIPNFIIESILGKEFVATEHGDIVVPFGEQDTTWNIPQTAMIILPVSSATRTKRETMPAS